MSGGALELSTRACVTCFRNHSSISRPGKTARLLQGSRACTFPSFVCMTVMTVLWISSCDLRNSQYRSRLFANQLCSLLCLCLSRQVFSSKSLCHFPESLIRMEFDWAASLIIVVYILNVHASERDLHVDNYHIELS